jgi:hypothetical protein
VVVVVRLIGQGLLRILEQVEVLVAAVEALVLGLHKQAGQEILQVYRHLKAITVGRVGLEILLI